MQTRAVVSPLAWRCWAVGVAFVVLVFGFQTGYAVTNGRLAQSLGLTVHDIGLVGSVYTWCFAATQLLSGALLDRVGARRVLPLACGCLSAGVLLFAASTSFSMLVAAQVLVALGAAFGFVGAGFIGGLWFGPARFGTMFAWVQFVASVSACFSQQLFALALGHYPWQQVILTIGAAGVLLVGVMLWQLRDPDGWDAQHGWPDHPLGFSGQVLADVWAVARAPGMAANLAIGALSFGAMLALGVVWGPRLLLAQGVGETWANRAVSLAWLGLALGAPACAWLSDRLASRRGPLAASLLVQAAAILLMLWAGFESGAAYGLLMFVLGVAAGGSMLPFTIGAELAGVRRAGTAAALVNGSQFLAAGVLMALPGRLWEPLGSGQLALSVLPAMLLLALPLFAGLRETAPPAVAARGLLTGTGNAR